MLSRTALLVYTLLFRITALVKLVPYKWNSKDFVMSKSSRFGVFIWGLVVSTQTAHFAFVNWRFVEAIYAGLPTPVLMFQSFWSIVFSFPVILHWAIIRNMHDVSFLLTSWLHYEKKMEEKPESRFLTFVILFVPTGIVQTMTHGFMYVQDPTRPQYLYSVFATPGLRELISKPILILIFGLIELTLASATWLLIIFFAFFQMGASCSFNSWMQTAKNSPDLYRSLQLYTVVRRFVGIFNTSFRTQILECKGVVFLIFVICTYNTIRSDLPPLPLLLMPLTIMAAAAAFCCYFPPMCDVRTYSQKCVLAWVQKSSSSRVGKALWRGQPVVGIEAGHVYVLISATMFTFLDLIVQNVISALITF